MRQNDDFKHVPDSGDELPEEEVVIEDDEASPRDLIKKLRTELKACQKERQEYLEGWQRSKADYINLKKTEGAARQEIGQYAREGLLHDFIALADNFDMAFSNREAWENIPENWRQGIEHIHNQLLSIFRHNGLEDFSPIGQPFNPSEHHSVATMTTDKPDNDHKIMEVLKRGYKMNGKVIRPAQVKVGKFEN